MGGINRVKDSVIGMAVLLICIESYGQEQQASSDAEVVANREAMIKARMEEYESHPLAIMLREYASLPTSQFEASVVMQTEGERPAWKIYNSTINEESVRGGLFYAHPETLLIDLNFSNGDFQSTDRRGERGFVIWRPKSTGDLDSNQQSAVPSTAATVDFGYENVPTWLALPYWPNQILSQHNRGKSGTNSVLAFEELDGNAKTYRVSFLSLRDREYVIQVENGLQVLSVYDSGKTYEIPAVSFNYKNKLVAENIYLPIEIEAVYGEGDAERRWTWEIDYGTWGGATLLKKDRQPETGMIANHPDRGQFIFGGGLVPQEPPEQLAKDIQTLGEDLELAALDESLKEDSGNRVRWFVGAGVLALVFFAIIFVTKAVRTKK